MAQVLTVYMVRHGETEANVIDMIQGQSDVPLNERGVAQAELVGARLRNKPFDAIYSSDLSRAAVTARAIAGEREINYTPELREWHFGAWQGKLIAEIAETRPEEYRMFRSNSSDFAPHGGESVRQFRDRAANFLKELAARHPSGDICCVTHGGFLRMVLLNVMNMEKYPAKARTDNTSISCFRSIDGGASWQLILWNDASHLADNCVASSGW
ncbi:MAG: histidine phosphatase family protein [Lentisphaeria bacterium]|nr:histidine phosphatase family protein [Lentisphaeria bacterium]